MKSFESTDQSSPSMPKRLRIGVIQLECHPYIIVGAREMAAEPFIGKKRPCLSRIASAPGDFNVRDLQVRNKRDYLEWHERRLAGVLQWLESFAALSACPRLVDQKKAAKGTGTGQTWQPEDSSLPLSQAAANAEPSSHVVHPDLEDDNHIDASDLPDSRTVSGPMPEQPMHPALIVGGLPDVMVFPEGAIARRTLKYLSAFAECHQCTIVAGTHAFQQNREAEVDYLSLRVATQDIRYWVEIDQPGRQCLFLMPPAELEKARRNNPYFDPISNPEASFLHRIGDSKIREVFFSRWLAVKEAWEKLVGLWTETNRECKDVIGEPAQVRARTMAESSVLTETRIQELLNLELKCARAFREWEYYKFCCMRLPTRSLLTVVHPNGAVSLRLKVRLSPFEHTSSHATNDPLADIERPRLMAIKMADRLLRLYPLVCSEALQGLHIPSKAELVAICSYQDKFIHFDNIIKHTASNQVPVIYCNDGVTGGSQVATVFDERGENWWLGEPNFGKLPKGDAILIQDITVGGSAPSTGVFNPSRHEAFVAAAAIIPSSLKYPEARLAMMLERIERTAFLGGRKSSSEDCDQDYDQHQLVRQMKALRDRMRATPVQRVKLDRLIQLVQNGQATRLRFWAMGRDCLVDDEIRLAEVSRLEKDPGTILQAASGRYATPFGTLKELERLLAQRCQTFARHLLESTREMEPEVAKMLMEVRDDCLHHSLLNGADNTENANRRVAKFFQEQIRDAQEAAQNNLRNLLGSVVERFQATSGSVFLKMSDQKLVREDFSKDSPTHGSGANVSRRKMEVRKIHQLVLTTAYNVPADYVESERRVDLPLDVPGSPTQESGDGQGPPQNGEKRSRTEQARLGIVGKVATEGKGYMSNDVERDSNYNRQIGTTQSEISVPIFCPRYSPATPAQHGTEATQEDLLGVLNLECNQRDAFLPVMLGELQAAAALFVPDLLLLRAFREQRVPMDSEPLNFKQLDTDQARTHALETDRNTLCCWHPNIHGWSKSRLLKELCECVTRTLDDGGSGTPFSCILWHLDRHKQVLYVRASCRYDYEYSGHYVLPHGFNPYFLPDHSFVLGKTSFTGDVACETDPTKVRREVTDRVSPFRRREKAIRMEVAQVIAGQIRLPEDSLTRKLRPRPPHSEFDAISADLKSGRSSLPPPDSVGTLSLYFFKHEEALSGQDVEQIFSDQVVLRLGEQVGELIDGCNALRRKLAVATLWGRLYENGVPFANTTELVKNTLLEIFDADGCSLLLAREDGQHVELHSLATTGLRKAGIESGITEGDDTSNSARRSDTSPFSWFPLEPAAQQEVISTRKLPGRTFTRYLGITRYLYDFPGSIVRKLDLLDPFEVVKVATVRGDRSVEQEPWVLIRPSRLCREVTVAGRSEHRRFLGMSISSRAGSKSPTLGVVRLVRNPSRSPFSVLDEVVLASLEGLLRQMFHDAELLRQKYATDRASSLPQSSTPDEEFAETQARLRLTSDASGSWNRAFVNGTLQDTLSVLRDSVGGTCTSRGATEEGEGFLLINLRIFHRDSQNRKKLQLYALHSELSNQPADEQLLSPPRRPRPSIGRTAIKLRSTVLFVTARPTHETTSEEPVNNPLFLPLHSDSALVKSGICLPFAIAREDSFFIAVLCADTDQPLHKWAGSLKDDDKALSPLSMAALEAIATLESCATKLSRLGGDNVPRPPASPRPDSLTLVERWRTRAKTLSIHEPLSFTLEEVNCQGLGPPHITELKLSTWLMPPAATDKATASAATTKKNASDDGREKHGIEEATRTLLESSLYQLERWGTTVIVNQSNGAAPGIERIILRMPLTRASNVVSYACVELPPAPCRLWQREGQSGPISLHADVVTLLCGCFWDWTNDTAFVQPPPDPTTALQAKPILELPLTPTGKPFLWKVVPSMTETMPSPVDSTDPASLPSSSASPVRRPSSKRTRRK